MEVLYSGLLLFPNCVGDDYDRSYGSLASRSILIKDRFSIQYMLCSSIVDKKEG